ncbi:MAG: redoxin family protein [Flavobacteriales bacterium]|nr:redoxin family protein [Flavobacteriales bacterium]
MKNFITAPVNFISALFICLIVSFSGYAQTANTLEIGGLAPSASYSMMNIDGSQVSITDINGENGALVIFTCNSCPFVVGRGETTEGWEGRYNEIIALASENGFGTLLVNSNAARRDDSDSFVKMKSRAMEIGYLAPYVIDEDSKLANNFSARTTPHVFLFNSDLELIYTGAIDDNVDSAEEVEEHFLKDAITRSAEGKRIKTKSTKAVGCSIKRVKS